jgi:ADP-ribose pyrophosphatase
MDEKVLNSKLVFQGTFLKVIRDRVRMEDGHEKNIEYIRHPGAACIIPLKANGKIIMEMQYRHPLNKIFLEFPAGKIDHGETTLQTAQRELKEETGYTANKWTFLTMIHPVIGYSDEKIDIYLAEELTSGKAELDPGEKVELFELTHEQLMERVRLGEVTDVKTQIASFWLDKILREGWKNDR